jgi:hypothetical protein
MNIMNYQDWVLVPPENVDPSVSEAMQTLRDIQIEMMR